MEVLKFGRCNTSGHQVPLWLITKAAINFSNKRHESVEEDFSCGWEPDYRKGA